MPEKWELTRKGTIKTTSVANARRALEKLGVSGVHVDGEPNILYENTQRSSQIRYEVTRYLRSLILDKFGFAPTYAAVEDAVELMADERGKKEESST